MYETDFGEPKMNPMECSVAEEKQMCVRATELLSLLRDIDCLVNRVNAVLFAHCEGDKKCDPDPRCLSENIDMAIDEARVIAKSLDKIICRL